MADKEWSRRSVITGVASSGITGNVKTPVFDTFGFESIMFLAVASATNASNRLAFRMSTASASGGMSDATGEVSHTTTGVLVLDVRRPTKRYVQGRYSASGATSPAAGLIGIMYGARSQPTTQPAETKVTRLYSPGSGTASG
jgi:hypothetical protein